MPARNGCTSRIRLAAARILSRGSGRSSRPPTSASAARLTVDRAPASRRLQTSGSEDRTRCSVSSIAAVGHPPADVAPPRLLGARRRCGRIVQERSRGRCGSRDRIPRRAETSRRRPRWPQEQQISDAHDPFRGRVARQLTGGLIWRWRDWTCTDAASGWPEASTVGYGSARGATAAHRRSDG